MNGNLIEIWNFHWIREISIEFVHFPSILPGTTEGNCDKLVLNKELIAAYIEFRDFVINELKQQQNDGVNVDLTQAKTES